MAIQTFEGQGYTTVTDLAAALLTAMRANGFTTKFPAVPQPTDTLTTLEVGSTLDPLHSPTLPLVAQPYRIRIAVTVDTLQINAGTQTQLPDDGTLSSYPISPTVNRTSGLIGVDMTSPSQPDSHFIDRTRLSTVPMKNAMPMSYKLTLSPHGFALAVWEAGNDNNIDSLSWFVIQRSVDNTSGAVTGIASAARKAPVFCVFSIFRPAAIPSNPALPAINTKSKFVVRELDVLRPTENVAADVESNDVQQSVPNHTLVSILETGSYNVNFLSGLNTQRFVYPQDELDIIAYTSADVISTGLLATFTAYGEATPRSYRALPSSSSDNTNVRILMFDSQA